MDDPPRLGVRGLGLYRRVGVCRAQVETVTVGASLLAPLFGAGACGQGREGESAVLSCGFVTMNAGAPSSAMVAVADGTVTSRRVSDASAVPESRAYNADIEYPSPAPPVVSPTVAPTTSSQAAPAENAVGPTVGCVVPKVVGKKLRSAKKLLRKANCRIGLVSTKGGAAAATGGVVRQVPNPGKVVPADAPVSLRLGHA